MCQQSGVISIVSVSTTFGRRCAVVVDRVGVVVGRLEWWLSVSRYLDNKAVGGCGVLSAHDSPGHGVTNCSVEVERLDGGWIVDMSWAGSGF